jgi:hypothetical protein
MHKKPCSSVLTAASIAASKEEKIFACRADLMDCCVFVREIPLLQKKCATVSCVVLKIHRLVICYNWLTEQASGRTKVLSGVVRQCL